MTTIVIDLTLGYGKIKVLSAVIRNCATTGEPVSTIVENGQDYTHLIYVDEVGKNLTNSEISELALECLTNPQSITYR